MMLAQNSPLWPLTTPCRLLRSKMGKQRMTAHDIYLRSSYADKREDICQWIGTSFFPAPGQLTQMALKKPY